MLCGEIKEAVEKLGIKYSTATKFAWVSREFEFCERSQNVPWSGYYAAASHPDKRQRAKLLATKIELGRSFMEIGRLAKTHKSAAPAQTVKVFPNEYPRTEPEKSLAEHGTDFDPPSDKNSEKPLVLPTARIRAIGGGAGNFPVVRRVSGAQEVKSLLLLDSFTPSASRAIPVDNSRLITEDARS